MLHGVQVIPNLWKVSQNDRSQLCIFAIMLSLSVGWMGWAPQKTKCTSTK